VRVLKNNHGTSGNESWLLQQDNAPAHSALSIQEVLAKNNIAILEQPLYSPNLDPVTFFSSPNSRESIERDPFSGLNNH